MSGSYSIFEVGNVVAAGVVVEQLNVVLMLHEFSKHELVLRSIVVARCKLREPLVIIVHDV